MQPKYSFLLAELSEMHGGISQNYYESKNRHVGRGHEPQIKNQLQALAQSSSILENTNEKYTTADDMAKMLKLKHMIAKITMKTDITIFLFRFNLSLNPSYVPLCSGSYIMYINCFINSFHLFYVSRFYNILDKSSMIGDIKKMSLSYAKCPAGDLHNGEILSLVCVDAKCQKRGLICPICRMMNHEQHEVLPLKIFIDEVKKSFLQSQDSESLNNLTDYLRSIDQSKKQLLNILRQTAQNIAKELKKVEEKIQQNYVAIRKNILAQSTMSTKLPIFIQNLIKKQENDPYWLQQQFQKYSQLIKYEKSTIQISDKAKKIVEDYSELPKQIQSVLKEQTQKIKSGFKQIFAEKTAKSAKKSEGFTFSHDNKHKQINISDDKKEAYTPETLDEYGMVYVKQESESINTKITFKITSANSASIVLGVGQLKKDKDLAFLYSLPVQGQHFCLNSDGYCENQISESDDQEVEEAPTTFNFHENGAEVTIQLEGDKNQITFSKGATGESKVFQIDMLTEEEKKDLQFFVVLGENDRVKIVSN